MQDNPVTQQPTRTRLAWGPFSVGLLGTIIFAALGWCATTASDGHWWSLPVGVVCVLVTLVLALSAGLALFERGGSAQ